jgi:hypothetical protein
VLPSIVGNGLSVSKTPGAIPSGITNANRAETNFAFGWLRSKLTVTFVAVGKVESSTDLSEPQRTLGD